MRKIQVMFLVFAAVMLGVVFSDERLVYAGNSHENATEIAIGDSETEDITEECDKVYFKVTTNEAGWLSFHIESKLKYTDIIIYDEKGIKIAGGNYNYNSTIQMLNYNYTAALEGGTYYVLLHGSKRYYGQVTVTASFESANNKENEPNNSADTAQALFLDSEKMVRGFLSWNDMDDYYKVTMEQAGKLTVNLTSYMERIYMNIVSMEGIEIYDSDIAWDESLEKKIVGVSQYLEKGAYIIRISGKTKNSTYKYGAYEIAAACTKAENMETEPNNTVEKAMKMALNKNISKKINALISLQDTEDYYMFTMLEDGSAVISFSQGLEHMKIKIFDGNNKVYLDKVYYAEEGKEQTAGKIALDNLSKGDYYILVDQERKYECGVYTLQIKVGETSPEKATVDKLNSGAKTITGTAEKYSTVVVKIGSDSYKATADWKGKFQVSVPALKKAEKIKVYYVNKVWKKSPVTTVVVK